MKKYKFGFAKNAFIFEEGAGENFSLADVNLSLSCSFCFLVSFQVELRVGNALPPSTRPFFF